MAPMKAAVSIKVKSKVFPGVGGRGPNQVLEDIDLDIATGSFVVITGPSGCGKSTLLNVVAGLDEDYVGEVQFQNQNPRVAYMFQAPRLLPWRTVYDNIALVLGGREGDEARIAKIPDMLARVGLSEFAEAYPERISLGMQRRAALARSFILEPDILLMDEPFVSLDDPSAQALRQLLLDMLSSRPTTVLFVTHDRMEGVRLASRLIRVDGSPAQIVQDSNVELTLEQRQDDEAVLAERNSLFGDVTTQHKTVSGSS